MKILWVNPNFLHPTTKGGQIRSLEMLRHLNRWHEIHYMAFDKPEEPEGVARAGEYAARVYPVKHFVPPRRSVPFLAQAAANLLSPLPLAVSRYRSRLMRRMIEELAARERFDRVVCDFLFPAPNLPRLETCVLFQHNVETTIWQRHAQTAGNAAAKAYFHLQAQRMFAYEKEVCRKVRHVIAVSGQDAARMREMFALPEVSAVPTGVDLDFFAPPPLAALEQARPPVADLVFVGSMDWMPNIDGVEFFMRSILPLIRRRKPGCTVAIVGRTPPSGIVAMGRNDSSILVTGTVPDIRPFLWGSTVAIVPLRIGGGTRLKIYEAMAAKIPVVSTTIGAEGLPVNSGEHLSLADTAEDFAARCLELLDSESQRAQIAAAAWDLVSVRFSWEHAARVFERILVESTERL